MHCSVQGANPSPGRGRAVGALGGSLQGERSPGGMVLQSPRAGWGGPCPALGEQEGR